MEKVAVDDPRHWRYKKNQQIKTQKKLGKTTADALGLSKKIEKPGPKIVDYTYSELKRKNLDEQTVIIKGFGDEHAVPRTEKLRIEKILKMQLEANK